MSNKEIVSLEMINTELLGALAGMVEHFWLNCELTEQEFLDYPQVKTAVELLKKHVKNKHDDRWLNEKQN